MDVDGRTVVYIEVVLDRTEGRKTKHADIGEEIAQYISGDVYVEDSVYEVATASDVTDYVGPLIKADTKKRHEKWLAARK